MSERVSEKLVNQSRGNNNTLRCDKDVICYLIGDYGKWQFGISVLMGFLKLSIAWFQLGIVFLAPPQKFWCKKPPTLVNVTNIEWIHMSKPNSSNSFCDIYDPEELLSEKFSSNLDIHIVPCTEFEYDVSIFSSTIVSEWNLVCSRQYYVDLSQVIFMLGVLLGNIFFGLMADKYGPKKFLFCCIALQTISSFATAFSPLLSAFMVARFLLALSSGGIAVISFVMCMEVVGGVWRTIIPILYQVPFAVGNSLMAGMAYVLRDWRHLQLTLSILSTVYLVFFFLIPESPRWLLATGQNDKAIVILEKIAHFNGRNSETIRSTINNNYIQKDCQDMKKTTLRDLFVSKNMRFKTIILSIEWFMGGLCFFAFSQHVGLVGKNIFLTVIAGGLTAIPGVLMCIPMVQKFGCKITVVASQTLTALCFLLIITVPVNAYPQDWPRIIFSGLGIFGLSVGVPALCLYTGELYPTVVRNTGVGYASMFSRLGSMVSPFIVYLERLSAPSPFILLSILTIAQTGLLYPLPNTKGQPLFDTIQQAECYEKDNARRHSSNFKSKWDKRRKPNEDI